MSLQHPLEAGRLAQATKKADTAGETDSSKVPRQVNTGQVSQPYKDLSLEEGVVELCRAHSAKWHVEGSTLSTLWTRCPSPPDPFTSEFLPGSGVLSPSHPLTNPVMEPPPKCLWAPLDSILYTHVLKQSGLAQLQPLFLFPRSKQEAAREGRRGQQPEKLSSPILQHGRPGFKSSIS